MFVRLKPLFTCEHTQFWIIQWKYESDRLRFRYITYIKWTCFDFRYLKNHILPTFLKIVFFVVNIWSKYNQYQFIFRSNHFVYLHSILASGGWCRVSYVRPHLTLVFPYLFKIWKRDLNSVNFNFKILSFIWNFVWN